MLAAPAPNTKERFEAHARQMEEDHRALEERCTAALAMAAAAEAEKDKALAEMSSLVAVFKVRRLWPGRAVEGPGCLPPACPVNQCLLNH